MPRTKENPRLVNRTARTKLAIRRDPYWHLIGEGKHLGYRRTDQGGTWIARMYTREHGRKFQALGNADDATPADGVRVLTFDQATKAAQDWFVGKKAEAERVPEPVNADPYTVADAMEDYIVARERVKRKALYRTWPARSFVPVGLLV